LVAFSLHAIVDPSIDNTSPFFIAVANPSLRTSIPSFEMFARGNAPKSKGPFKVFEDPSSDYDELALTPRPHQRRKPIPAVNNNGANNRIPRLIQNVNTNRVQKPRSKPSCADARHRRGNGFENFDVGAYNGAEADDEMASDGGASHRVEKGYSEHCGDDDRGVEMEGVANETAVGMTAASRMAIDGGGECGELENSQTTVNDDDGQSSGWAAMDGREVRRRVSSKEIAEGSQIPMALTPVQFEKCIEMCKKSLRRERPKVYLEYSLEIVNAIFYREENGCLWKEVPGFGSKTKCVGLARTFRKMKANGSWPHFERYRTTINSSQPEISLENFSDEELSALAKRIAALQAARSKVRQN
jgi:hypothetical protein